VNTLHTVEVSELSPQESTIALAFVHRVCQQLGQQVRSIILFGSRARDEAQADSDMDILVIVSDLSFDTKKRIRNLAFDVWLEYGIFLSILVWSESHWQRHATLQTALYRNLQRDGIELLNFAFNPQLENMHLA